MKHVTMCRCGIFSSCRRETIWSLMANELFDFKEEDVGCRGMHMCIICCVINDISWSWRHVGCCCTCSIITLRLHLKDLYACVSGDTHTAKTIRALSIAQLVFRLSMNVFVYYCNYAMHLVSIYSNRFLPPNNQHSTQSIWHK